MKKIKKLLLILLLFMSLFLVGCGKNQNQNEQTKGKELQRYRVKVVEKYEDNDHYIVEKYGYSIGGIYYLETNKENLKLGDIVYVIVLDDYRCMLFSEYLDKTTEVENE
jgi:ABC-type oligopeptide transport system substrate-binding subunit